MTKTKRILVIMLGMLFAGFFLTAEAGEFDAESALQVSSGIAEWKLMNGEEEGSDLELPVYALPVSSGAIKNGLDGTAKIGEGLSALSQNQVDPIIWWDIKENHPDLLNIPIYKWSGFPNPGGHVSNAQIIINPATFGNSNFWKTWTPGGIDPDLVIAHEFGHAAWNKVGFPSTEAAANVAELDFNIARMERFSVENKIAQDFKKEGFNVKTYRDYQEYRLDPNRYSWQLNNIPYIPQSGSLNPGSSTSTLRLGTIQNYSGGISKISYLPPPEKLFSTNWNATKIPTNIGTWNSISTLSTNIGMGASTIGNISHISTMAIPKLYTLPTSYSYSMPKINTPQPSSASYNMPKINTPQISSSIGRR